MNMNIVDRRANPKGKSLSNRQRFLRARPCEVKDAVQEALRKRKVADVGHGEKVAIPTRGISEPIFHHNRRTGRTDHVVPGNKEYLQRRRDPAAESAARAAAAGRQPGRERRGRVRVRADAEEFLDMFFEDLELPDLVKKSLKETTAVDLQRAGYTVTGTPSNLSVPRTMRNSMARRIALEGRSWPTSRRCAPRSRRRAPAATTRRPKSSPRSWSGSSGAARSSPTSTRSTCVTSASSRVPKPNTQAVMFCLMDVSGSMTEAMKDLAKRFFMLLHVFLPRRYGHVDIVFIRHTTTAEEVDEETFFYSRETGGTVVSTALEKMLEIARARYPTDRWNIYGAQASDGDNYGADSGRCVSLLGDDVLPLWQYFAYIEVGDGLGGSLTGLSRDSDLWRAYDEVRRRIRISQCGGSATRPNFLGVPRIVRKRGRAC